MLNIMSSTDPFFSQSNESLGNPAAKGQCAEALRLYRRATIVLIPGGTAHAAEPAWRPARGDRRARPSSP
jgi:hypothetical protein